MSRFLKSGKRLHTKDGHPQAGRGFPIRTCSATGINQPWYVGAAEFCKKFLFSWHSCLMLLRYVCTCVYDSNTNKSPGTKIQSRRWMMAMRGNSTYCNCSLYAEVSHILRFFKSVKLSARDARHTMILRWLSLAGFLLSSMLRTLLLDQWQRPGPKKKISEFLSIGSSKRIASNQSLLTVSKRKSRCRKWFLLSIFVLQIPGLPLN